MKSIAQQSAEMIKSLTKKPIICILRHNKGHTLAVNTKYTDIYKSPGYLKTGIFLGQHKKLIHSDKLSEEEWDEKFYKNFIEYFTLSVEYKKIGYNILSESKNQCKLLSNNFIPENIIIPHYNSVPSDFNFEKKIEDGDDIEDINNPFSYEDDTIILAKSLINSPYIKIIQL